MGKQSDRQYEDAFLSPIVRAQYVHIIKRDEGNENSSGKFSIRGLLPKKRKEDFEFLMGKIAAVYPDEDLEDLDRHPFLDKKGNIRDGDTKKNATYEGHPGCLFFNCLSDNKPETFVLDDEGDLVECDPNEVYAGCYVRLLITPSYSPKYNAVDFFLTGVVKVKDGDRFSNARADAKSLISNWLGGNSDAVSTTKKGKKAKETDDDDNDRPAKKAKKEKTEEKPKKKNRAPIDDDEDDDYPGQKKLKKLANDDDEDDGDDDDDPPPARKKKAKAFDREQTDDDEDEDERPKKGKKPKGKSLSRMLIEDDDDDE